LKRRTESGDDLVPKKVIIVEIVILLETIAELKSLKKLCFLAQNDRANLYFFSWNQWEILEKKQLNCVHYWLSLEMRVVIQ
jgi:hypothetical protein